MRRVVLSIIGTVVAVSMTASVALAARQGEPGSAKKVTQALVAAYADCPVTDGTFTGGMLTLPACEPAVPNDTTCGFDPALGGKGSLSASITGTPDIKIKAKVKGLSAGCIGETLCLDATIKITTDVCTAGADCTSTTLDFGGALGALCTGCCCIVDATGKCSIKNTINTPPGPPGSGGGIGPGTIVAGDNANTQIKSCGLRRTTNVNALSAPPAEPGEGTLACGLLIP